MPTCSVARKPSVTLPVTLASSNVTPALNTLSLA